MRPCLLCHGSKSDLTGYADCVGCYGRGYVDGIEDKLDRIILTTDVTVPGIFFKIFWEHYWARMAGNDGTGEEAGT